MRCSVTGYKYMPKSFRNVPSLLNNIYAGFLSNGSNRF